MLLTSVTCGSGFPMLVQKSSSAVNSDQQYFRMLRNIYEPKKWSGRWWVGLYTIVAIRYVRVSVALRLFEDFMEFLQADVSLNSWKSCTTTMCTSPKSPTGHPIRGIAIIHPAKPTSPNLNSNLLSLTWWFTITVRLTARVAIPKYSNESRESWMENSDCPQTVTHKRAGEYI